MIKSDIVEGTPEGKHGKFRLVKFDGAWWPCIIHGKKFTVWTIDCTHTIQDKTNYKFTERIEEPKSIDVE